MRRLPALGLLLLLLSVFARNACAEEAWTREIIAGLLRGGLQSEVWDERDLAQRKLSYLFVPDETTLTPEDIRALQRDQVDLPVVVAETHALLASTADLDLQWRLRQVQDAIGVHFVRELDALRLQSEGCGFYGGMFDTLRRFGGNALPYLRAVAYEPEHSKAFRNCAAAALGELGEPQDIEPLLAIAADAREYNYLRLTAAFSAYALGGDKGVTALIAEFEAGVNADPRDYTALARLAECYARAHRWGQAESAYLTLLTLFPNDSGAHYNLALVLCGQGRGQDALEHMNLCVKNGFRNLRWMESDPGLELIRDDGEYRRLVTIVEARIQEDISQN